MLRIFANLSFVHYTLTSYGFIFFFWPANHLHLQVSVCCWFELYALVQSDSQSCIETSYCNVIVSLALAGCEGASHLEATAPLQNNIDYVSDTGDSVGKICLFTLSHANTSETLILLNTFQLLREID